MINSSSQCIFDICHVLRNLRDTMEYVDPNKEHDIKVYEAKKNVLLTLKNPNSFLGKFIEDNKDKLEEFIKKYDEFLDEIYGDKSQIITIAIKDHVTEGEDNRTIRIDHTQHQKIYDYVVYLSETLRDILYSHVQYAKQNSTIEPIISDMLLVEERFDRTLKAFLMLRDYQTTFYEFQKIMGENQGKPTPQSDYIVKNELSKMANMIRFNRLHAHCTDNETLDQLDEINELLEMTEGRRDRRGDKSFSDLFTATFQNTVTLLQKLEPAYQQSYQTGLKEMLETIKANQKDAGKPEA